MNTYKKFCPNVFVAQCEEPHEKGDIISVATKYGKENECIVHNLVGKNGNYYLYSIVRADGYNMQERARRKAEQHREWAESAINNSKKYFEKANKDRDFLSLGEPIKVGHHSEKKHRKAIEDNWNNTGKAVEFLDKAQSHESIASAWERHTEDVNLSIPESLDYFKQEYEKAKEYHEGLKSGKYPKEHSYSMAYANKAVKELKKKYELAVLLWGD